MDGKLIEQVLVNLLDNAIKYTPEGSEIAVTVQNEENRVVFEVSDNGKGLDEKDIPHLFDMFYTANQNGDSRRGLVLGLALCRACLLYTSFWYTKT